MGYIKELGNSAAGRYLKGFLGGLFVLGMVDGCDINGRPGKCIEADFNGDGFPDRLCVETDTKKSGPEWTHLKLYPNDKKGGLCNPLDLGEFRGIFQKIDTTTSEKPGAPNIVITYENNGQEETFIISNFDERFTEPARVARPVR
jgi:hypothetical protein